MQDLTNIRKNLKIFPYIFTLLLFIIKCVKYISSYLILISVGVEVWVRCTLERR